jgi:hypothetical protein
MNGDSIMNKYRNKHFFDTSATINQMYTSLIRFGFMVCERKYEVCRKCNRFLGLELDFLGLHRILEIQSF